MYRLWVQAFYDGEDPKYKKKNKGLKRKVWWSEHKGNHQVGGASHSWAPPSSATGSSAAASFAAFSFAGRVAG